MKDFFVGAGAATLLLFALIFAFGFGITHLADECLKYGTFIAKGKQFICTEVSK